MSTFTLAEVRGKIQGSLSEFWSLHNKLVRDLVDADHWNPRSLLRATRCLIERQQQELHQACTVLDSADLEIFDPRSHPVRQLARSLFALHEVIWSFRFAIEGWQRWRHYSASDPARRTAQLLRLESSLRRDVTDASSRVFDANERARRLTRGIAEHLQYSSSHAGQEETELIRLLRNAEDDVARLKDDYPAWTGLKTGVGEGDQYRILLDDAHDEIWRWAWRLTEVAIAPIQPREPAPPAQPQSPRPHWDDTHRILYLGSSIIKEYDKQKADRQRELFRAFQVSSWGPTIPNPFLADAKGRSERKIRDNTLQAIRRSLGSKAPIAFSAIPDGVSWHLKDQCKISASAG